MRPAATTTAASAPRRTRQSGSVIVWAALALTMLFSVVAVVLNTGHLVTNRGALQNAADSAALAAALDLAATVDTSGRVTAAGIAAGTSSAIQYAGVHQTDSLNRAGATAVTIPGSSVRYGVWTNNGPFVPSADLSVINAVEVRTQRAAAGGNAMTTVLSPFVRSGASMDVTASAVAKIGGRCDLTCPGLVPVVLVECNLAKLCGRTGIFVADSGGKMGDAQFWTSFNRGSGASTIRTIIDGSICGGAPDLSAKVGECLDLVPGVKGTDLQALQSTPYCNAGKHAPSCDGNVSDAVLPVVCRGTSHCPGSHEIVAFVTATIVSVADKGSNKGVTLDIACGSDSGNATTPGTCATVGSVYVRPVLVR